MNNVAVIGLGYIGLPTATILAQKGFQVHGVDIRQDIVDALNAGQVHIEEPDLDMFVEAALRSGSLMVSTQICVADVFIIAVPTPFVGDHQPDLTFVEAATRSVAPFLRPGNLVILESTSPVGTTRRVSEWLGEERPDLALPHSVQADPDIYIAHCPERVLPGRILRELIENDRIIGGLSPECTEHAVRLYKKFVVGKCLSTDAATAEMAKLAENAYRDVNIAFANELSLLAPDHGVNVWELIRLANHHPRVNILSPGPGVGGHCIAVDPWFLVAANPKQAKLIKTARDVNDSKPEFVIQQVQSAVVDIENPRIVCLGLAFKANVDDLRESPALDISVALADIPGVEVLLVEPHISRLPSVLNSCSNVRLVDIDTAIAGAHICVLLVDHEEFKDIPSLFDISHLHVIDTRGQWNESLKRLSEGA